MGIQKKHGKGRLDKWYKLAKEKNYRARSAFKLIQLNQKYGFLEKSKVLIDLCAAPGGWLQVAAESMPNSSLIIGVDLTPIKPIPKCTTLTADITTDKCRSTLRQHLKTWKADTVLHDGAPNVGTAWVQDAFSQAQLTLEALKLATDFLIEGGTFVTKVFRSKDYNSLLWVFNQLFAKVEATKPPSSRNVSAEIFVVCRGFKAPKTIDPQFLDPRTVFEELPDPTPNNEAKVYNPEKKKRKRDGYEEGNPLQFKEVPVTEFIETTDPIQVLGSINKLSFERNDIPTLAISKLPETNAEVRTCCDDLRVLGRRDFKLLLRWRLQVREHFGLYIKKKPTKEAAVAQNETAELIPMEEELRIEDELQRLREKDASQRKKQRRKENEKKQKDIVRLQLQMTAPTDLGLDQDAGPQQDQSIFKLKPVDGTGALKRLYKGKMDLIVGDDALKSESEKYNTVENGIGDDEEEDTSDELEAELDQMYDMYKERKEQSDAKYRAKKARSSREGEEDEWEGIKSEAAQESSDEEVFSMADGEPDSATPSSDDDDNFHDEAAIRAGEGRLITRLDSEGSKKTGVSLSKRAAFFFDQDIFKEIDELEVKYNHDSRSKTSVQLTAGARGADEGPENIQEELALQVEDDSKESDNLDGDPDHQASRQENSTEHAGSMFEIAKSELRDDGSWCDSSVPGDGKASGTDISIVTAEAMALAQRIASGSKSKADLIDGSFNKYSFRSKEGLPDWFLDDEAKHSKPLQPVTAAAAAAIKEKIRALNARPIKKVKEARDRKKFKAHQRMEKLRKKSALLVEDEGLTEKEKARKISSMINKATKKKPTQRPKLVVARGANRGVSGRPRGVKGKYKIVDPRLKKDARGLRRAAKRAKK